ncbi:hypothetical protein [Streptomyces vastus]|uniref:hypothetical protein n=1 Tax=Streptomyces vastus TaxID=285451 RepID=UPI0031DEF5F2
MKNRGATHQAFPPVTVPFSATHATSGGKSLLRTSPQKLGKSSLITYAFPQLRKQFVRKTESETTKRPDIWF